MTVGPEPSPFGIALKCLGTRVHDLEHVNAALQEQLEAAGLLCRERFEISLQRHRFAAARRKFPCSWDGQLVDLLCRPALTSRLADFAGPLVRVLCQPGEEPQNSAAVQGGAKSDIETQPPPQGQEVEKLVKAERSRPHRQCSADELEASLTKEEDERSEPRMAPLQPGQPGLAMIYIFGGNDDQKTLSSCERFNPLGNMWEPVPSMSQARSAAAAVPLRGRIYVCGGNHCGQTLSSVEAFDPTRDAWEVGPSLRHCRSAAGAAELQGKLYICGGWGGKQALASCERLDPASGQWEVVASMTHRREWPIVTGMAENLYLCGGQDGSEDISAVEIYTPSARAWELLEMKVQCRRNGTVAVLAGQLYLCGGHGPDGRHVLSTLERFDPMGNAWTTLTSMQTYRRNAMSVVVAGRVFIMGGRGSKGHHNHGGGHALRTSECYDAATDAWEAAPAMAGRRYRAASAAWPMLGFTQ